MSDSYRYVRKDKIAGNAQYTPPRSPSDPAYVHCIPYLSAISKGFEFHRLSSTSCRNDDISNRIPSRAALRFQNDRNSLLWQSPRGMSYGLISSAWQLFIFLLRASPLAALYLGMQCMQAFN